MKKVPVTLFILFNFVIAYAQLKEYNSAVQYYKWGDYDKAKESIDKALTNEKTMNEPKTWYYKGVIYHALYLSKDKSYKSLTPANCPDIIFEAYKKALLLDFKEPKYHTLDIENKEDDQLTFLKLINDPKTKYIDEEILADILTNKFPSLASIFFIRGAKEYDQEKAYEKALKTFENSILISSLSNRIDTVTILNAAISAEKSGNIKKSSLYYKQLTLFRFGKNDIERVSYWLALAKSYLNLKDTVNYLKTLKSGIEKYPKGNFSLLLEITNYYIKTNRSKEALNYIKTALSKDSKNGNLLFSEASIYQQVDSLDIAIVILKQCISLDSTKIDPLYLMGVCHLNKGVELLSAAGIEKDDIKAKKMSSQSEDYFHNALTYFEKAYKINPKDVDVLFGLKQLYYKLKMNDKYEAIKKEIESLKK